MSDKAEKAFALFKQAEGKEQGTGEWFEVRVGRDVDLNGIGLDRAGDSADPDLVTAEACLAVATGDLLVFARSADVALNGGDRYHQLVGYPLV